MVVKATRGTAGTIHFVSHISLKARLMSRDCAFKVLSFKSGGRLGEGGRLWVEGRLRRGRRVIPSLAKES